MIFDVYFPFKNKEGRLCPGVRAVPKELNEILELSKQPFVTDAITRFRGGDKEAKKELPAVCFSGHSKSGKRLAADMEATNFYMIDIDHCEDPRKAWDAIINAPFGDIKEISSDEIVLAHITPSGKGLRVVFWANDEEPTIIKHILRVAEDYHLKDFGDVDTAVKDLGRLSFLPLADEYLFISAQLYGDDYRNRKKVIVAAGEGAKVEQSGQAPLFSGDNSQPVFTEDEKRDFEAFTYRGVELKAIVNKYVEVYGEPGPGEKHSYYNEMVKNFRVICDNNKRLLLFALPKFGHTDEECWSQIVSICRVNTLSRIPKAFYFFLKDNGFYSPRENRVDDLREYMLSDEETTDTGLPYLPPVFRELVGTAPKDFVLPAVNALLPILGTLTSYLKAKYPYDNREHTTSFFSIIYAPPGTGKGFVERFLDLLFEDLKLRDYVQSERENVYLRVLQRKGANDKAPDMPHVSLRLIPPKNSEAEFLQKQRDNHGYHMFTYAAEMDSWAKGVRAAGGNKDDMIRIAWDNGEYGQQFKSANTFKGTVKLFWNVLITGTIAQIDSYFKNVENGLVTRCSFTEIENQEFSMPPSWKNISKRGMETIKAFMKRCDNRTYETPCNIDVFDLETVSDDNFDKEINWQFKFKERRLIDMSWIMPTIDAFHKEQMELAARDIDRARDVFRRRVGVRGFRLAMICYGLWENPRPSDLQKCVGFVDWWMHKDIESILKLWGARYNEQTDVTPKVVQRTVFDALEKEFSRNDVYAVCLRQGIKTPVRRIVHDWTKLGYVTKIDKDHYKKK